MSASYDLGAFKNYVGNKGWVGGQSNVYAYKVNEVFFYIKGDAKKSSTNVLLNNTKLINPRVKLQAKGQK